MGPDDILNGIHISFFILFVRTGFPRIGGTSPHVGFRWDLSQQPFTKRLSEGTNGCERPQPSRSITAIEVLIGTWRAPGPSAPPNPVLQTSTFHFDGSLPAGHDSSVLCRTDSCFDPLGIRAGRTPLFGVRSFLGGPLFSLEG
jgi:hypothetical protein